MYDGKEDEAHDRREDGYYAEFRINFDVSEPDENDMVEGTIASVEQHIHHIPPHAVVDALLVVAKNLIADSAHIGMIDENGPRLADGESDNPMLALMKNAFISMYLKQRIDSDEVRKMGLDSVSIPNDVSSLLDD